LFNTLLSLRLGGREIALHTYGVLIAVGLAAGIAIAYREGRRRGFDGGRVLDAAFWMIVAGLVGSRVVYGVVNAGDFARLCVHGGGAPRSAAGVLSDCTRILAIWQGGLVFYGGVAGAALVGWRFARRAGWSFATFGDLFAPALALGHAFGRLGCFAAGCCYGRPTTLAWGVVIDALGPPARHPVQLVEAALDLVAAGWAARARGAGVASGRAMLGYAAVRLLVEPLRDPVSADVVGRVAPSAVYWCAAALAFAGLRLLGRRDGERRPVPVLAPR